MLEVATVITEDVMFIANSTLENQERVYTFDVMLELQLKGKHFGAGGRHLQKKEEFV